MTDKPTVKTVSIDELIPDVHNANKHTERGTYLVGRSIEKLGTGRSILVDKDNEIIAGNLTAEQAVEMGIDEVIIVETDGNQLVAVKRTDLDLTDKTGAARELAYVDNRSSEFLEFDTEQMTLDIDRGLDLSDFWHDWELDDLGATVPDFQPVGIDEQPRLDQKKPVTCPECGYEFAA